jgi:hypothetical protein
MKAFFLFLGLGWAAFAFNATAQVDVAVSLDQNEYLPGEAVAVALHVTNHSGQTLHLGDDQDWLSFFVETDDGVVVKKSDPPVVGAFDLGSSEMAIKHVNLGPYFELARLGHYKVMATVHLKAWNQNVTSQPEAFDVIQGATLWSQVFGVPNPQAPNSPPDVRKYTLLQANYLSDELRLYIQVSDESAQSIVKVSAIGPMISFSQPEAQLDPASDLHVLYQNGASTFDYTVIDPDGDIISETLYDYIAKRPRLRQDENGNISVYGGIPRVEPPAVKAPDQLAPQ